MDTLLGSGGLLRYSDDDRFTDVARVDWSPDDEEDLKEQVRLVLDDEDSVRWMARCDGSGLVPGFDTRAAVALDCGWPWSDDPHDYSWVVLIIKDDESITVIEYPSEQMALAAFKDHVDHQDAAGDRYDYVYQPLRRRTAWPV
jgi:hypothetical protein